jgi:hypothetical protein
VAVTAETVVAEIEIEADFVLLLRLLAAAVPEEPFVSEALGAAGPKRGALPMEHY